MNELVEQLDILAYIGQYVDLKPKGSEYVGLSPFTHEKTPSFFVHPDKKCWYCFSSGQGGNIIRFAQKFHHVNYEQACQMLIEWGHISLANENCLMKIIKSYRKKEEEPPPIRTILPNDIMDKFKDFEITSWIKEGISPEVLKKYNVRYDTEACRIVFPIWDIEGNLINIKGRAAHAMWKEFRYTQIYLLLSFGQKQLILGLSLALR